MFNPPNNLKESHDLCVKSGETLGHLLSIRLLIATSYVASCWPLETCTVKDLQHWLSDREATPEGARDQQQMNTDT